MTARRRSLRWKIGALEKASGVTRDAIHHYVRLGLLPRPEKASATVAFYDERHLARLQRIRALRAHGLALPLIGRLLDAGGDHAAPEDLEAVGKLLAPGERTESAQPLEPGPEALALAGTLGFTTESLVADPRLGAALEAVVRVPAAGRTLAAEAAGVVVAHARAVAAAVQRLTGAWLACSDDGPAAVAALREARAALRDLAAAARENLQRAETERGFQEIVTAAAQATRARWLPAGSAAGAGGVAMLAALDARVEAADGPARGDPSAHHARVRLLYGVGPARRLGDAARSARSQGVDGPWVALGAGVSRLDSGDLEGARSLRGRWITVRGGRLRWCTTLRQPSWGRGGVKARWSARPCPRCDGWTLRGRGDGASGRSAVDLAGEGPDPPWAAGRSGTGRRGAVHL